MARRRQDDEDENSGFAIGRSVPEESTPVSRSSDEPSRPLSRPAPVKVWEIPGDMAAFTAQANQVAVAILNEEIGIDKARVYASIARVVSQTLATQVAAARLARRQLPEIYLGPKKTDEVEG